jgi:hypothetical protein
MYYYVLFEVRENTKKELKILGHFCRPIPTLTYRLL